MATPRHCAGWAPPVLQAFIRKWTWHSVNVDGCVASMVSTEGHPIKQPWRFITSDEQQALALQVFKCNHHPNEHQEAAGKEAKLTEIYPLALATALLGSLFPHSVRVPALSCDLVLPPQHIPKETHATGFVPSPFMWSEIFAINTHRRGTQDHERGEL